MFYLRLSIYVVSNIPILLYHFGERIMILSTLVELTFESKEQHYTHI
jgi:hypothetical protein